MNKDLIPIIAAYWGAQCSYERHYTNIGSVMVDSYSDQNLDWKIMRLLHYSDHSSMRNFKLHLRELWSITEEELIALALKLGLNNPVAGRIDVTEENDHYLHMAEKYLTCGNMDVLTIREDDTIEFIDCDDYVKIINYLRLKGFCLDQELIDAGLVEWI